MRVLLSEPAICDPSCDIRIGKSSWDDKKISIKYAVPDKNGKTCASGEFPIEALPQMFAFALQNRILKTNGEVDANGVENWVWL